MKAIVQQVEIRNSEMFYNSRFVRTRNYKANLEAGKFQHFSSIQKLEIFDL